jgi:hypothetical protein
MAIVKSVNLLKPSITCCCSGVHFDVAVDDGEELLLAPGVYTGNPEGLSPPQALNPRRPTATTDTETTERQDFTCAIVP